MRRIVILLAFIINYLPDLPAQELKNNTIGVNLNNSLVFWQANKYSNDSYDYLGIGSFLTPTYKLKMDSFLLQLDLTFGNFSFIGPDELTDTWSDDDIDNAFRSEMERRELGLQINYSLYKSIDVFIKSKYFYMDIRGDNPNKFETQKPFSYLEKGIFIGPGVDLKWPFDDSRSYVGFSLFYLMGQIDYTYYSHHISYLNIPEKDKIEAQLLSAKAGYNYQISPTMIFGIALESDYFFRTKYFHRFRYRSDVWFLGLDMNINYSF